MSPQNEKQEATSSWRVQIKAVDGTAKGGGLIFLFTQSATRHGLTGGRAEHRVGALLGICPVVFCPRSSDHCGRMGPSSHESYFTSEAELPVSCCRGDPQIVSYTNRGVVVVEKLDEESDQCYEDYHCWISSGEKSPKVSPTALNPLTPHPIPASLEGDECGHGRKVSFFNDVTVDVFDQESPTRELQGLWPDDCSKETHSGSLMTICRDNPNITGQSPPPPGNHLGHPPQLSTSGVSSEDIGVSLEWEDDFSVLESFPQNRYGRAPSHHIRVECTVGTDPPVLSHLHVGGGAVHLAVPVLS
ncbi:uncharacterized protein LOC105031341 isoform X2 [Esox lucius]|uniref:uncharacterized protein LOC105031341 isoform X2 n=1 Tax=Esox lucius TaxID=8010 RepID=UPI0014774450|nr:uncharacterized protein LOC105031341 isoform X2 [Esox lucius]